MTLPTSSLRPGYLSLFPVLAFSLLLASCSSTRIEKGFYAEEKPKYRIEMDKEGRKHGTETWWHPNGRVKYEATNRHGLRDGRFTAWFQDGGKWYEGFEQRGKPESTLTYWHPNGKMKSQALYRDGIQLERKDWDENGRLLAPRNPLNREPTGPVVENGPDEAGKGRQASLQVWAMRVRQTVESYWRLPKELAKKPHEAVARIQVGRDGRILKVTWLRRSSSAAFNKLAQQTFRKVKRLPPFPPEVKDESLEIQYEFVSQGKTAPRRRLEARGQGGDLDEEVVPAGRETVPDVE
jgi:TonB family protein